ncbi:MAG: hypothetical protein EP347_00455 [Alphaproteobacteria bacterium]|nr:MAG: hypothetical protein EP347_00455 [Alphaproteobacteria bacterium]
MTVLLPLHYGFAMLWLGCVITEALFERALLSGDRSSHLLLADLHVKVDKFVEIPAMCIVTLSGIWLWRFAEVVGAAFYTMVCAGCIAILANVYCVVLVFKRRDAAHNQDWAAFDILDHRQHKFGGLVLIGLLVALGSGHLSGPAI